MLAGVGSVTLVDDPLVTEVSLNANFLISPDETVNGSRTVSEVCCESLKDFNPMVNVSVEKGMHFLKQNSRCVIRPLMLFLMGTCSTTGVEKFMSCF